MILAKNCWITLWKIEYQFLDYYGYSKYKIPYKWKCIFKSEVNCSFCVSKVQVSEYLTCSLCAHTTIIEGKLYQTARMCTSTHIIPNQDVDKRSNVRYCVVGW